ncbi:hypothetical protein HRI97_01750 [Treponema socranskii subsp. buccale]|jgi:hypothetical protein|uniref:hypothetical protein n=1 Tax=Treponema socranskii TaxID=53419 RepID=UPI0020A2BFF5|nr:hypothetical protein [Treponema socranskii]UTD01870.1 hypothetical protein HRI97_01750 [Treponema socranskii subsp. buccale]
MKKSLNSITLIVLLIIQPCFSLSPKVKKGGFSKDLFKVSIAKVKNEFGFGELVDVYYPAEIMPCFIFVFRNENYIYEVMANSENLNYLQLSNMDLNEYISLGFLKVKNVKTNVIEEFFFTGNKKEFDFLDNTVSYTSIVDLENQINMELIKIDKGGFLFPFYTFIYKKDNHILEVICTPNSDKRRCYFVGGWTYH